MSVETQLAEIAAARPEVEYLDYGVNLREYGNPFKIWLPHGCKFTRNFIKTDEAELLPPRMLAGLVFIPEPLRGNGIGRRLSGALGAYAILRGAKQMESHVVSEYSLDNLRSLYGDERLQFWQDTKKTQPFEGDIDAVRSKLVALAKDEKNLDDRRNGFVADINLAGLDVRAFEMPMHGLTG